MNPKKQSVVAKSLSSEFNIFMLIKRVVRLSWGFCAKKKIAVDQKCVTKLFILIYQPKPRLSFLGKRYANGSSRAQWFDTFLAEARKSFFSNGMLAAFGAKLVKIEKHFGSFSSGDTAERRPRRSSAENNSRAIDALLNSPAAVSPLNHKIGDWRLGNWLPGWSHRRKSPGCGHRVSDSFLPDYQLFSRRE